MIKHCKDDLRYQDKSCRFDKRLHCLRFAGYIVYASGGAAL